MPVSGASDPSSFLPFNVSLLRRATRRVIPRKRGTGGGGRIKGRAVGRISSVHSRTLIPRTRGEFDSDRVLLLFWGDEGGWSEVGRILLNEETEIMRMADLWKIKSLG